MAKKSSFKYFIGYNDSDNIRSLCRRLPKMIGCGKYFKINNKTMSVKVIDKRMYQNTEKK